MVCKKDFHKAELETVRISKIQRRWVTAVFLQEAQAVHSLGILRGTWMQLPLDHRSNTTSHQKWQAPQL